MVCKYGQYHGIVYFVGNHPDWDEIKSWLHFLEQESIKRQKYVKAYFVYGNEHSFNKDKRLKELEQLGQEINIKNVALIFVPSFWDIHTEVNLNKINPAVENSMIVYKNRRIIDKYINLKSTANNFKLIAMTLNKTRGDYFELPEPKHE